jgi:hypothetical protein
MSQATLIWRSVRNPLLWFVVSFDGTLWWAVVDDFGDLVEVPAP